MQGFVLSPKLLKTYIVKGNQWAEQATKTRPVRCVSLLDVQMVLGPINTLCTNCSGLPCLEAQDKGWITTDLVR